MADMAAHPAFVVGTRNIRSKEEFQHWHEIRKLGFTEWYLGRPSALGKWRARHLANVKARLFPEYCHQVRTTEGKAVGYLATVPGYWSGEISALQDLSYYDEVLNIGGRKEWILTALQFLSTIIPARSLFDRLFAWQAKPLRARILPGSNCVVLVAITVDPQYQKMRIPQLLLTFTIDTSRARGLKYVIAPFRPSAYGKYKAERKVAHSVELFKEYCELTNEDGWPLDPWLRTVRRLGASFVKLEPKSFRVTKSIGEFDEFRTRFKPGNWYSPGCDVWECGETQTWYVDRCKQQVISVEPNYFGVITVKESDVCTAEPHISANREVTVSELTLR